MKPARAYRHKTGHARVIISEHGTCFFVPALRRLPGGEITRQKAAQIIWENRRIMKRTSA